MSVQDTDLGFDAMIEGITQLVGSGAKVGLLPPSSQEVIDRGAWNEFGTATIPARPFMRNAVDSNTDTVDALLVGALVNAIEGNGAGATDVAVGIQKLVKDQIQTSPSWAIPNTLETVILKGHDHPLIDTGEMLDSISFVVTSADAR